MTNNVNCNNKFVLKSGVQTTSLFSAFFAVIYVCAECISIFTSAGTEFDMTTTVLSVVFGATPAILFSVYVAVFYEQDRGVFILPTVFGTMIIGYVITTATDIIYLIEKNVSIVFDSYVVSLVYVIFCGMLLVASLRGLRSKALTVIPLILFLLLRTVHFVMFTDFDTLTRTFAGIPDLFERISAYGDQSAIYTVFDSLVKPVSSLLYELLLYASLLLFVLGNRIRTIVGKEEKSEFRPSPELELRILKNDYKLGNVSEDVYLEKRVELELYILKKEFDEGKITKEEYKERRGEIIGID